MLIIVPFAVLERQRLSQGGRGWERFVVTVTSGGSDGGGGGGSGGVVCHVCVFVNPVSLNSCVKPFTLMCCTFVLRTPG